MAAMSRVPAPPAAPSSRPSLLDYFLVLAGCGLSHVLLRLDYVKINAYSSDTQTTANVLADLLRLAEGVILLWPLFFAIQRVVGRGHGLTAGEWLWVLAWLGNATLIGLAAWHQWGSGPEVRDRPIIFWAAFLWYVIVAPSMALCAVLIVCFDMVSRKPRPWTHQLSLVLVLWPVPPLAAILALGKFT
jgi:hypothetical protein